MDQIIREALAEEEAQKKRRKQLKRGNEDIDSDEEFKKPYVKNWEEDETGPIREQISASAKATRASKRRGAGIGDTDLVEDVEAIEEDLEPQERIEEEGGIKIEAFNLKEERKKGYFDEAGTYIERKEESSDGEEDAWIDSEEAKLADPKSRQTYLERRKRIEESEKSEPLTSIQIARHQWQISQILRDGETVTAALRRLGGSRRHASRKDKRAKVSIQVEESKSEDKEGGKPDTQLLEQLTDAATALIDSGDVDVYSKDRNYFKTAASVYIDIDDDEDEDVLHQNISKEEGKTEMSGPGTAAYESADEDMFADEDNTEKKSQDLERDIAINPKNANRNGDETDFSSWPIKELRRFCKEKGVNVDDIVEKSDLIEKTKEAASRIPITAARIVPGERDQPPPGYVFDSKSKYYFSQESGMYWDAHSGGFYNPTDGKWYGWQVGSGWIPWSS